MDRNSSSFSISTDGTMQHLLKMSYSENTEDQQKAAMELSRMVEGTVFPAFSFGPLSHALCRLIPSRNRTVASYAARALKTLILDDALRPQVLVAGVPAIVCTALKIWEDEILVLRELLGCLQTLCWDKNCVRAVLQNDIVSQIVEYIQCPDVEVSVLALATLANILYFSDTVLLTDSVNIEVLASGLPKALEVLGSGTLQRAQRFYAAAGIANATAHPQLAEVLKQNGGLQQMRELEHQSLKNLHILGSKMGDCASVAVARLSVSENKSGLATGNTSINNQKFRFKWGTKPTMELSLALGSHQTNAMWLCFAIWLFIIFMIFSPFSQ